MTVKKGSQMPLTNEQLAKQLETMLQNINKRLDEIEERQDNMQPVIAQFGSMSESLKEVIRIVRGSNGTDGLIIRMDRLQNSINIHTHTEATRDVRTALYGDENHEGLVHAVDELKKWKASLDRWAWFLATTMIVSFLNLAITLAFYVTGLR